MQFNMNINEYKKAGPIPSEDDKSFGPLLKDHKISSDEYRRLKSCLGRAPTFAELGVFSAMWSEHCSYKSSRVHLKRLPSEGSEVVVGPGENAGVVRLHGKLCAAFKMESHNHPSYIEPYQGAATGVGGILRDVFCMGARPIANLNCLRFGQKSHPKTAWLFKEVVKGIGDYGNCVGIPTVGGNVVFDKSYDGNCLVNAMTVGLIEEDKIFKGFASGPGNLVVYVGSATGRDGIHGATMASDSFDSQDESERSAVQVGDPFMEKLLMEATLSVLEKDLVVGIQDMGAAGLTSSSFEMADRAGTGLWLDLNKVPTRTLNMSAYELLLSESQERMLMVIEPQKWEALSKELEKWQLAYSVIGQVTETGRFQAVQNGVLEVDLDVAPLVDAAPKYDRPRKKRDLKKADLSDDAKTVATYLEKQSPDELIAEALNYAGDKSKIYRQYDHHIGNRTIFSSEHQGAALLHIREGKDHGNTKLGMSISTACLEKLGSFNAHLGGALSVLKCARSIAATGSYPLAITDCLNFGNPEVPEVMQDFSDAVDGISEACNALNTPVVSGNVSLYNETDGKSVHPTPMIGMVGKIENVDTAIPPLPYQEGSLFAISSGVKEECWSGSLIGEKAGLAESKLESLSIDWEVEKKNFSFLKEVSDQIVACGDIGRGGLMGLVSKWFASTKLGVELDLSSADAWNELRFAYLAVAKDKAEFERLANSQNLSVVEIGKLDCSSNTLNWVGKGKWSKEEVNALSQSFLNFKNS